MNRTGLVWDEKCFWHSGGNYALLTPVGGFVQPLAGGGLPEAPETKRRLQNLIDVSGLASELVCEQADPVDETDLLRVHPMAYSKRDDTGFVGGVAEGFCSFP